MVAALRGLARVSPWYHMCDREMVSVPYVLMVVQHNITDARCGLLNGKYKDRGSFQQVVLI